MKRPAPPQPAPEPEAEKIGRAAEISAAFHLGETYAYPNPARKGAKPTVHVEAGIADSVELRFYDLAGDLLHRAELRAAPQAIDDGQGPEYAYEYAWTGDIPSGTYLCAVTARKSGEQDLHRTIKLAVVR